MLVEYALLLVLGVCGIYFLAPPVTSTAAIVVCCVSACVCVLAVFLIWRMFRDK